MRWLLDAHLDHVETQLAHVVDEPEFIVSER